MKTKPLFALATLAGLSGAAHAQFDDAARDLNIGGQVGVYLPTSGRIRDAFGSSVLNVGLGPVGSRRPSSGSLTPDLTVLSANKNGNKLFIGSFTYGYEKHLGDDRSMTVPYVRVFGGAAYFDYGIDQPGGRESAKRVGAVYGAEAGVVVANRLKLSARYNVYSKQGPFDFNGLTLSATYSLFRL